MKITNCPNCGAPLAGMHCRYCGTELKGNFINVLSPDTDSPYGTLNIGGHEYSVYFGSIDCKVHRIEELDGRCINGTVERRDPLVKREFIIRMIEN